VEEVRERLDDLRKFWRELQADVERAVRAGKYSWWSGTPDEETTRKLGVLSAALRGCADSFQQTQDAILPAGPKKPATGKSLFEHMTGRK
jgi:hypothetical protein